ncbi:MAG: RyR domain-containing protein [Acidimicrobiia bacterium]
MIPSDIAHICHEANRAYCTSIGDYSQPTWDTAPEWQRASAIAGVQMKLENPTASPREMHEAWLTRKTSEGWVFGPVKNVETKEHPCCVAYDCLPPAQQAKDGLFSAIVEACRYA